MYEPRTYRNLIKGRDLVAFTVQVKETDLYIRAWRNLAKEAEEAIKEVRRPLEDYIGGHPRFQTSLKPVEVSPDDPAIVREMAAAGHKAGVGPMAAVAGAIAEAVGKELLRFSPEVIVENGGDIFLRHKKPRHIGIYAGDSPLSGKLALEIEPEDTPLGVCTSSGTVGHSLSFGKADAAIVISPSTALADAAATAVGNLVKTAEDMPRAIEFVREVEGLTGIAIIVGDKMAVWGKIKLVQWESAT